MIGIQHFTDSGKQTSPSNAPSNGTAIRPSPNSSLSDKGINFLVSNYHYTNSNGHDITAVADVASGHSNPGTVIITNEEGSTLTGERWDVKQNQQGHYILVNGFTVKGPPTEVLTSLNGKISLQPYNPKNQFQLWDKDNPDTSGNFFLHNVGAGNCLTDTGNLNDQLTTGDCIGNGIRWSFDETTLPPD